jgi:hypothetical protein
VPTVEGDGIGACLLLSRRERIPMLLDIVYLLALVLL